MLDQIRNDLYRWYGKKEFGVVEYNRYKMIPQIRFMIKKRKVDYYRNHNRLLFLFHMFSYRKLKVLYGVDLPASVKLGEGVVIEHIGGITINPEVSIGNNCNIYNGVTIGIEKRGKRKGVPTIGNKVWMGSNSIIVGNINVGDNVLIAPGAYVNFDVPDDSIVLGNPGRVIQNANATEAYIENLIGE